MANITKKYLDNYLNELSKSGLNLKLQAESSDYTLLKGDKVLFKGSAKETYIFLNGLSVGTNIKVNLNSSLDDYTGYSYVRDKFSETIIIRAKKVTENTYYDQYINKYTVKIQGVHGDIVHFTAKESVLNLSGYRIGNSISIPMLQIKVDKDCSIDKTIETMLKTIDAEVVKMAKKMKSDPNPLTPDYVLWLTKDSLKYIGWGDMGALTKSVDYTLI